MSTLITIVLTAITAVAIIALVFDMLRPRKRRPYSGIGDAANQLRIVMKSEFHPARVLSRGEYKVFECVENLLARRFPSHRVLPQTSMGEFLSTPDDKAFRCINAKRVDMLVIDKLGYGVAAIEFQGAGHHQNDAAARDAVKREALRRANIAFIEVFEHHTEDDIRAMVSGAIERARPIQSRGPVSLVSPTPA